MFLPDHLLTVLDPHSHLVLLLCLSRFSMSWVRMHWNTKTAQFYYRTAFVSAIVTYGIVVYKVLRARAKAGLALTPQVAITLLGDENVQYLRTMLPSRYASPTLRRRR